MIAPLRLVIDMLRPFLVTVLAFMMLTITSAHVRETVMVKLQENGVQRFYETEVLQDYRVEVRLALRRLGRKPIEERLLQAAGAAWPPVRRLTPRVERAAAARAPPNQPRAPPTA